MLRCDPKLNALLMTLGCQFFTEITQLLISHSLGDKLVFQRTRNIYIGNSYVRRLGFHYLSYCLIDMVVTGIAKPLIQALNLQPLLVEIFPLNGIVTFFIFEPSGKLSISPRKALFQLLDFIGLVDTLKPPAIACYRKLPQSELQTDTVVFFQVLNNIRHIYNHRNIVASGTLRYPAAFYPAAFGGSRYIALFFEPYPAQRWYFYPVPFALAVTASFFVKIHFDIGAVLFLELRITALFLEKLLISMVGIVNVALDRTGIDLFYPHKIGIVRKKIIVHPYVKGMTP